MNILIFIITLMGCSNKVMKLKDKPLTSEQQVELNKKLLEAAKNGDLGEVTQLLGEGIDVNNAEQDGKTPLMLAASNGHVEVITALIAGGANVNHHARQNGWTALIFAAWRGHSLAITRLIDAGANVNNVDKDGATALMWAGRNGHAETIKLLLAYGSDVNHGNRYGATALMFAARNGNAEVIKELIKAGANVNNMDKDGYTALMWAARNGNAATITALIECGANVNHTDEDEFTKALMLAAKNGHVGAIRAFIACGANVNDATEYGLTALMLAAREGHVEVIRALIESGVDVNHANESECTALMFAAENGNAEAITEMIEAGADVNQALIGVARNGHVEAIIVLIKAGANVDQPQPDGYTAFMNAAENLHLAPFMKAYAKVALELPADTPDSFVISAAFSLFLLFYSNSSMFINPRTNISFITSGNINGFISNKQLDLSLNINNNTIHGCTINPIKIIYEHLLTDVFNQMNGSSIRDKMLDVVNGWDIPTKRKILRSIFRSPKLNEILLGEDQSKKKGLREMLRLLLLGGVYCRELNISKEQIYKVFEDEIETVGKDIERSIVMLLINIGWK